MSVEAAVDAGKAAWARLRGEKKSWQDWLAVGRAIQIGKAEAMKIAKTNRCVGSRYNAAMGSWLKEHGLDEVSAQERYRLLLILQNLTDVGTWRNGLTDAERRKWAHPNTVWSRWRAHKAREERAETAPRHFVKTSMASYKNGRPIFWSQEVLRRFVKACRECNTNDVFIMARAVLDGTFPSENELIDQLNANQPPQRTEAPAAASAAHVAA